MTQCPPDAHLKRLLADSLDEAARNGVEAHVEECNACQIALQRLTSGPGQLSKLPKRSSLGSNHLHPEAEPFFDRLKRVNFKVPGPLTDSSGHVVNIEGYDILAEIGRGAAGVVYKARYRKLDRLVALKVILAGSHFSPEMRQRFRFEAQAVAKLKHPNIVQIYDVGEHAQTPYLSLELIEGGDLAGWLQGRPRPAAEAATVIAELAKVIQFAHRNGVVHRDLKPANVLLSIVPHRRKKRELKVADFGIAKLITGPNAGGAVTQTGEMLGTPAYMAPEQIRSDGISPATDVYAMGVILYEMLTGRPPFQGSTALDTMMQTVQHDAVAVRNLVPGVPRDLETICLKCLEKDPAKRYQTALALAADVERFLRDEPIHAQPLPWSGHTVRWVRRHRGLAAGIASAAMLALLLTAGALVASGYFRAMERQQHALAQENERIARENQLERDKAVDAKHRETELRQRAESATHQLRENAYFNQMHLGSQAAASPSGIGRIAEWLAPWARGTPDLRNWEWYYLNGLCHRAQATLQSTAPFFDIAWHPQGRLVASGGSDGVVRVWDSVSGEEVRQFFGHSKEVATVAWSPDAHCLASASYDGTVRVWNFDSGQELLSFREHTAAVFSVAWNSDGTRIASCGLDQTVRIWDAATGAVQFVLRGHKGLVLDVGWSPDGTRLASCGNDATVRIWDAASGKERLILLGHINMVNRVRWSHDGRLLASASNDLTTKVWNIETAKAVLTLHGQAMGVTSLAFSPDNQRLAACSADQTIKVYAASDGRELSTMRGHSNKVTGIAWSPDGTRLASSGMDQCIKLWNAAAGDELPTLAGHNGPVNGIAWSPDSRRIASVSYDRNVRVWDVGGVRPPLLIQGHTDRLFAMAWSADGARIATAGEDHTIRIWNAEDGHPLGVLPVDTNVVLSLAWSPDGRLLASGGDDKLIRLWDTTAGTQRPPLVGHTELVRSIAWSPDGKRLASASGDQSTIIWDLNSGGASLKFTGNSSSVMGVTWSPDGRSIATACADQTVKIWDTTASRPPVTLKGHTTVVTCVAWSPDGTRLATGSEDRSVKLWDVKTGYEAVSLDCKGSMVRSIAWSPDGTSLAVGLEDHAIVVYDAQTGYVAGLSPRALPALDRHLSETPGDADGWRLRARINACHQNWTEATADINRCLISSRGRSWEALGLWTVGPFPAELAASYAPEQNPNLCFDGNSAGASPSPSTTKFTFAEYHRQNDIDFGSLFDHADNISAYTLVKIYSAKPQMMRFYIGSDDQNRVWLNGGLIHERLEGGRTAADSEVVASTLKAGWNDLLLRVTNNTGDHTLHLRLSTDDANPQGTSLRAADTVVNRTAVNDGFAAIP